MFLYKSMYINNIYIIYIYTYYVCYIYIYIMH